MVGERISDGVKLALLGIRLAVGAIFVSTAYSKLRYPFFFAFSLTEYGMLPDSLVTLVAVILPWLELLIGSALLLGVAVRAGAIIGMVLSSVFALAMLSALARGLEVNCGCYAGWSPVSSGKIALDLAIAVSCWALAQRG